MHDIKTPIDELRERVLSFTRARNWNPSSRSLAISIVLEAGELLEHFQWDDYPKYAQRKKRTNEIEKELADVIIYCLQFSAANKIDIAEAIGIKLKENAKKYPANLFRKGQENASNYYLIKEAVRKKKNK